MDDHDVGGFDSAVGDVQRRLLIANLVLRIKVSDQSMNALPILASNVNAAYPCYWDRSA
jgi:hypothetical protein